MVSLEETLGVVGHNTGSHVENAQERVFLFRHMPRLLNISSFFGNAVFIFIGHCPVLTDRAD